MGWAARVLRTTNGAPRLRRRGHSEANSAAEMGGEHSLQITEAGAAWRAGSACGPLADLVLGRRSLHGGCHGDEHDEGQGERIHQLRAADRRVTAPLACMRCARGAVQRTVVLRLRSRCATRFFAASKRNARCSHHSATVTTQLSTTARVRARAASQARGGARQGGKRATRTALQIEGEQDEADQEADQDPEENVEEEVEVEAEQCQRQQVVDAEPKHRQQQPHRQHGEGDGAIVGALQRELDLRSPAGVGCCIASPARATQRTALVLARTVSSASRSVRPSAERMGPTDATSGMHRPKNVPMPWRQCGVRPASVTAAM